MVTALGGGTRDEGDAACGARARGSDRKSRAVDGRTGQEYAPLWCGRVCACGDGVKNGHGTDDTRGAKVCYICIVVHRRVVA